MKPSLFRLKDTLQRRFTTKNILFTFGPFYYISVLQIIVKDLEALDSP